MQPDKATMIIPPYLMRKNPNPLKEGGKKRSRNKIRPICGEVKEDDKKTLRKFL